MNAHAIEYVVEDGALAGLDFGGSGTTILLVHGSGHNARAWSDVAVQLTPHCRVIAIDMRGHGQTCLQSSSPEQYWRDLGQVCEASGASVLIGHSSGGYASCAATAAGLIDPLALCVVDGVVLEDRATAVAQNVSWSTPEAKVKLQETMRYGWIAEEEQVTRYIEECARNAETDWLNAGARPELVREVMQRAFMRRENHWMRRPTVEEMVVVSNPNPAASVYPCDELYAGLSQPIEFIHARHGFYAARRNALGAIVAARSNRRCTDIDANHNVPMTRPETLAHIILDVVAQYAH